MPAISFPTSPTVGQKVTISGVDYTWNGTVWKTNIPTASISIDNLTDVDTGTTPPTIRQTLRWNGTNWVPSQGYIGISGSTPPAFNTIVPGTIWIKDSTLDQYIYIIDGSGNDAWISLGEPGIATLAGLSDVDLVTSAPTVNQVIRYNGTKWVPVTLNIDSLTDVDTTTSAPTNGQILKFNGTNWVPATNNIDGLTDVDTATTAPTTNQVLRWNGTNWVPATISTALSGLSDVTITTPANNNYLYYDSTSSKWVNGVLPSGSSSDSFYKNRIINGNMRISQKYNGASYSNSNVQAVDFPVDRFAHYAYGMTSNMFTFGKNLHGSLPLDGFNDYLGAKCGATGFDFSTVASSQAHIDYIVEDIDIVDFKLGTANARPFVLSFWYYASIAGTYSVTLRNRYGGAGTITQMRCFVYDFTVAASTWTKITVPVPAITTGGFWNTNSVGLLIHWNLGVNATYKTSTVGSWFAPSTAVAYSSTTSTQLFSTANALMAVTGVQLELGTVATNFEYPDYLDTLNKCRRYYFDYKWTNNSRLEPVCTGVVSSANTFYAFAQINYPTDTLKLPIFAVSGSVYGYDYAAGTTHNVSNVSVDQYGKKSAVVRFTLATAGTAGNVLNFFVNTPDGVFSVDSNMYITD